jgi:hypothetical protein
MVKKSQITSVDEVAKCDQLIIVPVEQRIYTVRNVQVMLDSDLAEIYGVETKRLNEQVRRNIGRFPEDFMFQLTAEEHSILKSQFATSSWGGRRTMPYAFTELGVAMLSSVLSSDVAIQANIRIMRAFSAVRRMVAANEQMYQRIAHLEYQQVETDKKIEAVMNKLDEKSAEKKCGIFFDGQTFDSYSFVSDRIREATGRIVLIDNYVDDTVLTMLDKRIAGVAATIYTIQISKALQLDIDKHNSQYPVIEVKVFKHSHDRFLIVDDKVYHFGASIKDLGKKWFAVSLMTEYSADELLHHL